MRATISHAGSVRLQDDAVNDPEAGSPWLSGFADAGFRVSSSERKGRRYGRTFKYGATGTVESRAAEAARTAGWQEAAAV